MLRVGGAVAVLPLSVVPVFALVGPPPGVLTAEGGPRHSWRRFPWASLAGGLPLAPSVSLLPMVSYRVVSPWWLSLTLQVAVGGVALSVVPSVVPVVRSLRALL